MSSSTVPASRQETRRSDIALVAALVVITLTIFEAGLVLLPFSALGFLAGRASPWLRQRIGPFALLAASGVVVTVACLVFAVTRTLGLAWPVTAMGVLGFGSGGFSASMPQAIPAVTPAEETAAAMSVSPTIRALGLAAGSALADLMLSAYTTAVHFAPAYSGYTTAAWIGAVLAVAAIILSVVFGALRRR